MKINLLSRQVVGPGMLVLILLALIIPQLWVEDPTSQTLFEEDIFRAGVSYETHQIPTADGFILTVFRLVQTKNTTRATQPVLLLHGLDEVAQVWVMNDDQNSPGLALHKEGYWLDRSFPLNTGYDVWLLNNRGTAYSRSHRSLHPGLIEYWDFSFQELAEFDVTAVIDYISRANDGTKVIAVGHSQGATQVLAALTDPKTHKAMESKIAGVVGLCPVGHMGSLPTKTITVLKMVKAYVYLHGLLSEPWPRLPSQTRTLYKKGMLALCDNAPAVCEAILWMAGYKPEVNKPELLSKVFEVLPGGASFRAYLHFGQLADVASELKPILRKFDFGPKENLNRYGQVIPPEYDWNNLSVLKPNKNYVKRYL